MEIRPEKDCANFFYVLNILHLTTVDEARRHPLRQGGKGSPWYQGTTRGKGVPGLVTPVAPWGEGDTVDGGRDCRW